MFARLRTVIYSIYKRGLIETIKMIFSELFFDYKHKVDTDGCVDLDKLNIDTQDKTYSTRYEPCNEIALEKVFTFLDKNYDCSNKTLLDYGCGKGRVLMYASKYNFKNLLGVEFASDLCQIAKSNVKKMNLDNIEIVNKDATEFDIPDGVDIFYFNNPFLGETFKKVLDNIETFFTTKQNKKAIIVYVNPLCKDMFDLQKYNVIYSVENEIIIFERNND